MTEISAPPEMNNSEHEKAPPPSPWVMLCSMLLLIAGLLLSSIMLLHYAAASIPAGDDNGETHSALSLAINGLAPMSISEGTTSNAVDVAASDNPETPSLLSFFKPRMDDGTRWPRLKLTGFGKSSGKEGAFAIINGEYVLLNAEIDGVKLIEIRSDGAVMEYNGEQRIISVERRD